MKLTTNIVLEGNPGRTQSYILQLTPTTGGMGSFVFKRYSEGTSESAVLLSQLDHYQLVKYGNDWYMENVEGNIYQIPRASVRLYFPQYSVDTYDKKATYILSLSTYVNGVEVKLGDFEIKRRNALACSPVRFAGMDEYCEYMDFDIADPYSIYYSQSALDIRNSLGCPNNFNNNCSLLHACLYVVEKTDTGYIPRSDWGSGQNSVFISDSKDINLHMDYLPDTNALHMILKYNGSDEMSLAEYMRTMYNCDSTTAVWEYVIMDEENIFYSVRSIEYITTESFDISFDYSFGTGGGDYDDDVQVIGHVFDGWDSWKEGLYVRGSISFMQTPDSGDYEESDYVPFITVFSNKMTITQEMFSMMIEDDTFPTKINLDALSMNNVNLTAFNKIVKNVTVVTPTDSTKNHLIQPVFYQTRDLGKVTIHPSVTENIAINLDSYKPQVNRFKLQVEGIMFNEIGRTSKGIIFKVYGNMLPKEVDEGVMYILNQDNDLVTTGKYNYIY